MAKAVYTVVKTERRKSTDACLGFDDKINSKPLPAFVCTLIRRLISETRIHFPASYQHKEMNLLEICMI